MNYLPITDVCCDRGYKQIHLYTALIGSVAQLVEQRKPEGRKFQSHLSHLIFLHMDKVKECCKVNYFLRMVQVGTETLENSSGEYMLMRSVCCAHMKKFTHVLLLYAR